MDGSIGNPLLNMNLILRPLENPNDPVWSVIISIMLLLIGVGYTVKWVLTYDDRNPGHQHDGHPGSAGVSNEQSTTSDTTGSTGH